MCTVYLCWQNNGTVLGIATSEERAREMCSEIKDAYMLVETDAEFRKNIDTTRMCIYNTANGFKTYEEMVSEV